MVLRLPIIFLVLCSGFCAASTLKVESCSAAEPSASYIVRPSLVCDYSSLDLKKRLLSLLGVRGRPLTVEDVESAFGLPKLRASISKPRAAWYDQVLGAREGGSGWEVQLGFHETFYPDVSSRPPRFRSSGRPTLIDPRRRGDLQLTVHWLQTGATNNNDVTGCLTVQELKTVGQRNGWRGSFQEVVISDVGTHPQFVLEHHHSKIGTALDKDDCVQDFTLTRQSDSGPD